MDYTELHLHVGKWYRLSMNISRLSYVQQINKARGLNNLLRLELRKVGAQPFWARRRDGKWDYHTYIALR
jgi:hypothetical protein